MRALDDAKRIVAGRFAVTMLLALASMLLSGYVVFVSRSFDAAAYMELPGTATLGILMYADVMRVVLAPEYRLDLGNVLKLLALTVIVFVVTIVCWIPLFMATLALHASPAVVALRVLLLDVVWIFLGTRFAFACFALKDYGVFGACSRSWVLTGRPTFLVTLGVIAPYYILWFILGRVDLAFRGILQPFLWVALRTAADFALLLLALSFITAFLARWMLECEHLHEPSAPVAA